jgi:hypothetical protein
VRRRTFNALNYNAKLEQLNATNTRYLKRNNQLFTSNSATLLDRTFRAVNRRGLLLKTNRFAVPEVGADPFRLAM